MTLCIMEKTEISTYHSLSALFFVYFQPLAPCARRPLSHDKNWRCALGHGLGAYSRKKHPQSADSPVFQLQRGSNIVCTRLSCTSNHRSEVSAGKQLQAFALLWTLGWIKLPQRLSHLFLGWPSSLHAPVVNYLSLSSPSTRQFAYSIRPLLVHRPKHFPCTGFYGCEGLSMAQLEPFSGPAAL